MRADGHQAVGAVGGRGDDAGPVGVDAQQADPGVGGLCGLLQGFAAAGEVGLDGCQGRCLGSGVEPGEFGEEVRGNRELRHVVCSSGRLPDVGSRVGKGLVPTSASHRGHARGGIPANAALQAVARLVRAGDTGGIRAGHGGCFKSLSKVFSSGFPAFR